MSGPSARTSTRTVRTGQGVGVDQWRTYQEAADQLGSTAEAVRVRARRQGWRRQRGNDGRVRVLVPAGLKREPAPGQEGEQVPERPGERPPEQPGQGEHAAADLRLVLVELLRDQAAEHRRERERAEAREGALRVEVERLAGRVTEAEMAAVEGWRTAAALARRLTDLSLSGDPAPPTTDLAPRRRGWLRRLWLARW